MMMPLFRRSREGGNPGPRKCRYGFVESLAFALCWGTETRHSRSVFSVTLDPRLRGDDDISVTTKNQQRRAG